jgi:hypothetical protein
VAAVQAGRPRPAAPAPESAPWHAAGSAAETAEPPQRAAEAVPQRALAAVKGAQAALAMSARQPGLEAQAAVPVSLPAAVVAVPRTSVAAVFPARRSWRVGAVRAAYRRRPAVRPAA